MPEGFPEVQLHASFAATTRERLHITSQDRKVQALLPDVTPDVINLSSYTPTEKETVVLCVGSDDGVVAEGEAEDESHSPLPTLPATSSWVVATRTVDEWVGATFSWRRRCVGSDDGVVAEGEAEVESHSLLPTLSATSSWVVATRTVDEWVGATFSWRRRSVAAINPVGVSERGSVLGCFLSELCNPYFKLMVVLLLAPSADEAVPGLPEVQEVSRRSVRAVAEKSKQVQAVAWHHDHKVTESRKARAVIVSCPLEIRPVKDHEHRAEDTLRKFSVAL
ncbi:hypothetical protein HPB49_002769 [Dermacentor silvarum]|uniref:Uncharacterized protein n=1 Tax=Dermacentor silvarum TaxID=543639 RepID=A0ACB8DAC0_DERSI|nr:hypothetical protein HPB49_002769 [Dermacentor silvarum]